MENVEGTSVPQSRSCHMRSVGLEALLIIWSGRLPMLASDNRRRGGQCYWKLPAAEQR